MMLTKNLSLSVKGLDIKNRIVEGYFAAFDKADSDNDVFVKGAFAKSISERGPKGSKRIKHLFNHWDTVGVLQELYEDDFGLHYVSVIGNHRLGEDVLKMYEDGIITEHSVGFQTIDDKIEITNGIRYLKEVKLWEGSSLDKWGANEWTPVVKSEADRMEQLRIIAGKMELINKALTGRTNYSDETYSELTIKLQSLETMIKSLVAVQPANNPTEPNEPMVEVKGNEIDIEKLIKSLRS